MTAPPSQHELGYAAAPPPHRRRVVRRVMVVVACLTGAIVLGSLAPHVVHRVRLVYWQNRALAHVPPPGHVVYDNGPTAGASPEAWRVLRGLIETSRSTAVATPFVGVLRSPAGVERLVAMELYAKGSYPALFVAGRVVEPGTLARPPRTVAYTRGNSYVAVKPTERARVHAGRVAPTDPSRLTIEFEVDGRRGRIDAWLTEDDEVVFAHHVEPSTSPATAR